MLIIFIIHTVRNYIILNKIFNQELGYADKTNISYMKKQYNENEPEKISTSECYRKDNKSMIVMKNEGDNTTIFWADSETHEQIMLKPEELTATKGFLNTNVSIPMIVSSAELNNFGSKLLSSMTSIISTDKINNEETYCIRLNYLVRFDGNKSWVSKENGMIIRQTDGFSEVDGKLYTNLIEFTDYTFDNVTDNIISKPNLAGYTVN